MESVSSFNPSNDVIIRMENQDLVIRVVGDEEVFQSLPLMREKVELPTTIANPSGIVTIDRKLFLDGVKATLFAIADLPLIFRLIVITRL